MFKALMQLNMELEKKTMIPYYVHIQIPIFIMKVHAVATVCVTANFLSF